MKFLMIGLFVATQFFYAQELSYVTEYGNFDSASSFDIDLNGNIYITDISENTITKLDSSGSEILSIGGYGWEESAFDEPVSIFTNTLSIYVADKNNDRIQRFDKDLNFLSLYSGKVADTEIEFAYPTCIEISNIGDLFILDSDNNSILKFDLTGEYLSEIGSNDAGIFALSNPKNFSIDQDGNIFVLDDNIIKIFDQFGNGQLSFELQFKPHKIHTVGNSILYVEKSRLVLYNLKDRKIQAELVDFPELSDNAIVDSKIINNTLLVLTAQKILKYKIRF